MTTRDQTFVDEASRESFPASDAPTFTATHAGTPDVDVARVETPRDVRSRLRADVAALTGDHARGADVVSKTFLDVGRSVTRIPVEGRPALQIVEARITGVKGGPELVIAAHFDARGAVDDASGIAVLLALARVLEGRRFERGLRLVAFPHDDPTDAHHASKASRSYAKRLHADRRDLVGMIGIDGVGFPRDRRATSHLPLSLRSLSPWRGDFVTVVGDLRSRSLVHDVRDAFRKGTRLPAHALPLPGFLPLARASDHAAFWRHHYPAVMVSDMGPLGRSRHLAGRIGSMPLDYDRMSDVVFGLASVVSRLTEGAGAAAS